MCKYYLDYIYIIYIHIYIVGYIYCWLGSFGPLKDE